MARDDLGNGQMQLVKFHIIREVATWENSLGKLPLEKMPLGKYLTLTFSE